MRYPPKRLSERMHGILLVDKTRGLTSHDIVALARRALCTPNIGHSGTLDPMATGLLVLAVGEATKLLRYIVSGEKSYQGTIRLGVETDTLDADGRVVREIGQPVCLSLSEVERKAASFVGIIKQRPPAVSAIKMQGKRLYKRVRQGESVTPEQREVVVRELVISDVRPDAIDFHTRCGKGFYLRALARDLSNALGTIGHLTALRRIENAGFHVRQAIPTSILCDAIHNRDIQLELMSRLIPLRDAVESMPKLILDEMGCQDAYHGRSIGIQSIVKGRIPEPGQEPVVVFNEKDKLVAITRMEETCLKVVRGLRY